LISVSSSSGADFRNNDWGDSPAEVMHYEGEVLPWIGGGPYSNNKIFTEWFAYSKKYLGIESSVFFKFTPEEKLGVGFCVPVEGRIKPFYLWEAALSDLFGETENRDDLLTEDNVILAHYYYGDAAAVEEGILSGYFALVRHWETETTNIWLVAELYDGKLEVHVNYYSKEYFDFFREEKKRNGPHAGLRPWFDDDSQ
jgi:hypothetical protein